MSTDWENSKENVAPVKRGRTVKGLGGVAGLSNKPVLGKNLGSVSEEKRFENEVEVAKNRTDYGDGESVEEAVLEVYISYYKWVRDTYRTSNDKSKAVLEKATSDLQAYEKLKNDNRYVKMWVELADMSRTPSETFGFMQSNKIGEKVALFWIAWAFVAEKAEKYDVTEQIFRKGIKKMAEPKELMSSRFAQFQRRMVSRIRNGELSEPSSSSRGEERSSGSSSSSGGGGNDGGRQALSSLSKSKTSKNSSQRTGSAISSRGAGGLARSENSVSASQRENRNGGSSSSSSSRSGSSSRSNTSGAAPAAAGAAPAFGGGGGNFTIFSDAAAAAPTDAEATIAETPAAIAIESTNEDWKSFGHESKRTKENHMPVTTWADAPLGMGAAAIGSSTVTAPAFAIFSDDAPAAPAPAPVADVAVEQHTALNMTREDLHNLSMMDEEDGTINTRLAMGTIDAMFCDSPPAAAPAVLSRVEEEAVEAPPSSAGFTIFSDN
jgi:hypothetical protein